MQSTEECEPEEIDPKETVEMFVLEARAVGKCVNKFPVKGFKRCRGQCNSKTVFRAQGISIFIQKLLFNQINFKRF